MEWLPEINQFRAALIVGVLICLVAYIAIEIHLLNVERERNEKWIRHVSKLYTDAVAGRTAPSQVVKGHAAAQQQQQALQ